MKISATIRTSFILLLTAIATTMATDVFASLQIYKVKGNVTIRKGKTAIKANRRDEVKKTDILSIPKDGRADVLDTDTRRIYSSKGIGDMTVKKLMDNAEAHAAGVTSNINRKVLTAMSEASDERKAYEAMGMAIHETDGVVGAPLALPEGTTYLNYLIGENIDSDRIHQCQISLKLVETDPGEDESPFSFAISNRTGKPLYFNIIEKGVGKGLRFLLPQNSMAAPKDETAATEYTFLADSATKGYIAIASEKDFSEDDVWRLLDPGYEPENNFYLTVVTL